MNEADLANMHLLEYWGKRALFAYDEKGASYLNKYIEIGVQTDEYVYLIHQQLVIQYYKQKPTVTRFRNIPQQLNLLYGIGKEKTEFENHLKKEAEKLNCEISELDTQYDDVDFVW